MMNSLQFEQLADGYRYSLDPYLLAGFCRVSAAERVIDLGTGVGVLPLLLVERFGVRECLGVELQENAARLAVRNLEANRAGDRVVIVTGDLRRHRELFAAQSFDVVVTNPPYRTPGTGRLAPDAGRAAARHELAGGLEDFVAAAAYLLKNGGRFYVVYLAERLTDLLSVMRQRKLEPKRLRMVHSRTGEGAKLVLVEGRRAGRPGLSVETPLYVYEGDHYSAEVLACYPDRKTS